MSIKFENLGFELGGILPYGWEPYVGNFNGSVMGHEFTMVGLFKIINEWRFGRGKVVDKLPLLQWKEKEFWYEGNVGGTSWEYKGETDKGDLYLTAPKSPTWGGFAQGKVDPRSHTWVSNPGCDVKLALHSKLLSHKHIGYVQAANGNISTLKAGKAYRDLETQANIRGKRNESEIAMWYLIAEDLAGKNRYLPCAALDRPGMAISGGSGRSGGGFTSLTTNPSRRRVLQFDLGIVGSPVRFTATQVLETIDAKPSISKFITPGQSDDWCKNLPESYLAYWRSRLNPANVEDQTYDLESVSTIEAWQNWVTYIEAPFRA